MGLVWLKSKLLILTTGLFLTIVIAGLFFLRPSFLHIVDLKILDLISSSASSTQRNSSIVIVDIDEKSLQTFGQWPWPRYQIANLLETIKKSGAGTVVVDILFSEPDRTSPAAIKASAKRDLNLDIEVTGIPRLLEDHDMLLAQTIAEGPFILANKFIFEENRSVNRDCRLHPIEVARLNDASSKHPTNPFFRALDVVCNVHPISSSVSHSGFINAVPDNDGILRRIPLILEYNGKYFPSLALAGLMHRVDEQQAIINFNMGGLESVRLDQKKIPVDAKGSMRIKYGGQARSFDYVSAYDILNNNAQMEQFNDKLVFVGTSAAGLEDYYQTPGGRLVPGIEIHATIAANIIDDEYHYKPAVSKIWEFGSILIAGIVSSLIAARFGAVICGIFTAVTLSGFWYGAVAIIQSKGILFSPLFASLVVLANFSLLLPLRYWFKERKAVAKTQLTLIRLKESEGRLNSILTTIPDVVYRTDRSGRIVFVNNAVMRYGYRPENLLGVKVIDLVAPGDRKMIESRLIEDPTEAGAAINGLELRMLVKDNTKNSSEEEWRYFVVTAEGLFDPDRPESERFIGTQGIARDISNSKQLQRQLLQSRKMEAIGTLAGGIAHDFNNLLMGIEGTTSLLLSDIGSDHPHFQRIKNIEKYVHGATNLTDQLLGFARGGQADSTPTNLNDIVKQSADLFGRTKKEIRIHTTFADSTWSVEVDQGQIEQVLLNLFINAWQAMPDGGDLFLETSNVVIDERFLKQYDIAPGNYVKISVADTGLGMDDRTIQRLFEPFFTTKERGRGTGLGLASAYGIIRNHKGIIDVISQKDRGSKFDIYLPATDKALRPERQRNEQVFSGSETILLVDDERMILDLGKSLLEKLGYQVEVADSGENAVVLFSKNQGRIDLVMLDMIMPGLGGQKTYEKLKTLDPDIPVLLVSGYNQDAAVKSLMVDGRNGFIQKPFGINTLSQKLREVLDGE